MNCVFLAFTGVSGSSSAENCTDTLGTVCLLGSNPNPFTLDNIGAPGWISLL